MTADLIFTRIIGPYGAMFLLLCAVLYLWRKLEQSQAVNARQQDLFEEALKVIRDDLVPLVRQLANKS